MLFKCSHTGLVDISTLKPNPKNPNKHPAKQIQLLSKIIQYQGQRSPIVVSKKSGFIVKGHARLEAIKALGWTKVAVDFQDYDDSAQEFADLVADNKIAELADHDDAFMIQTIQDDFPNIDLELLGLDDFELPQSPDEAKEEIEDDVPEQVDTRCKEGDLWILGNHRLLCGDATNIQHVERLMNGEKADMVFTDPPYGINIGKQSMGKGGGVAKKIDYGVNDWDSEIPYEAIGIAQTMAPITVLWGANYYAEKLEPQSGWIVWDKDNGKTDFADAELAWTNKKCPVRIFKWKWMGMIQEDMKNKEKRVHPTQKPIALSEWCFANYGKPKSVLDLFGGSGSTLIACEKTDRKCFMMEIDPHYCDVILSRWENYSGKKAELQENKDQTP